MTATPTLTNPRAPRQPDSSLRTSLLDGSTARETAGPPEGRRHLKIVVPDTGVGIPADKMRNVFDPFFTTKDDERNTGLGLSISKGIIDNHQGSMDIESAPGKGTHVVIELPTGGTGNPA